MRFIYTFEKRGLKAAICKPMFLTYKGMAKLFSSSWVGRNSARLVLWVAFAPVHQQYVEI